MTEPGPAPEPQGTVAPDGSAASVVAYAGEPGAFAEDAVLAHLGDVPRVPLGGFREVFEAVSAGRAAAGVVPIENLVNGTVRENYDLLLEHDLAIVGEVVVPVRLCLAARPGETLDTIERVYSHVQALGQAEAFLRTRPWTLLTTYNTAGAGRLIVERDERGAAAVLSPRAAALFGLDVLAEPIQSVPDNRTRFLVVARSAVGVPMAIPAVIPSPAGATPRAVAPRRTTLVFAVRNEPGTLLAVLSVFATRRVNLSKLESRPSRTADWEYVFWADLDGDASDAPMAAALDDLRAVTTMVRVLGSYPRAAGG
jgi:prephenate dehydratase